MNGERTWSVSVAVGIRGVRCWRLRVWSCSRWFYRCINVSYVPASELGTRGANGGPEPSGSLTLELTANGKTGIIQESQKQMPS